MEHLLLPGSPVVFLLAWFGWRIAAKAGYSGFWGLTAIIPPIGLVALWVLAAQKDWPRDRRSGRGGGQGRSRDETTGRAGTATTPAPRQPSDITIRRPGGPVARSD